MEGLGGLGFCNMSSSTTRKRRSNTSRRPLNDPQIPDVHTGSSLSSTPPSENNANKTVESDEGSGNSSFQGSTGERHTGTGSYAPGKESSIKVVKLKLGVITRTIDATSVSDGASGIGSSSTKASHISNALRLRQKNQENSDEPSITSDKLNKLGIVWKGFSGSGGKADSLKDQVSLEVVGKQTDSSQTLCKSKHISTQFVLGEEVDDADVGEAGVKTGYLEKVRTAKFNTVFDDEEEGRNRKHRKLSKVMKQDSDYPRASARLIKQGRKKQRSVKLYDDADYVEDEEEEEMISDREPESKRLKSRRARIYLPGEYRNEMTVTTRQRATQTGKDVSSRDLEEFLTGLPPAAPRKQKEKLSEMEQQLKKAEAAQRRRTLVEKAAKESEAEAIKKILGQDSSRKKREERVKRLQEEKAKERAATSLALQSHTVKWVMGPSGTVVTFPNEVGLPNIFESKPLSYPPPREQCAGPSCKNPYKYRDSKSKLPLCSLRCYKALQEKTGVSGAC